MFEVTTYIQKEATYIALCNADISAIMGSLFIRQCSLYCKHDEGIAKILKQQQ